MKLGEIRFQINKNKLFNKLIKLIIRLIITIQMNREIQETVIKNQFIIIFI